MNTLHQWLEGKKKPCHSTDTDDVLERKIGRNECIYELQASLPTILSTMEAEIRGIVENHEPHATDVNFEEDNYYAGKRDVCLDLISTFHNYFKTQI